MAKVGQFLAWLKEDVEFFPLIGNVSEEEEKKIKEILKEVAFDFYINTELFLISYVDRDYIVFYPIFSYNPSYNFKNNQRVGGKLNDWITRIEYHKGTTLSKGYSVKFSKDKICIFSFKKFSNIINPLYFDIKILGFKKTFSLTDLIPSEVRDLLSTCPIYNLAIFKRIPEIWIGRIAKATKQLYQAVDNMF